MFMCVFGALLFVEPRSSLNEHEALEGLVKAEIGLLLGVPRKVLGSL